MMGRMPAPRTFTAVNQTLSMVIREHGLEAKVFEHRLRRQWPDIVGDRVAAHTRPDGIRFKKLYVVAQHSVWLQQLVFLKPVLLDTINAAAGRPLISDIVLRVGEVPESLQEQAPGAQDGQPEAGKRVTPDEETVALAAGMAEAIHDPTLRAALTAVISKGLTWQRRPE